MESILSEPEEDLPEWPVAKRRAGRKRSKRRRAIFQSEFDKFTHSTRGRVLMAALAVTIVGAMIWQATPPVPAIEQPVLEGPRSTTTLAKPVVPAVRRHAIHTKHHGRRTHHKVRHSK